jgi:hypothetical protein
MSARQKSALVLMLSGLAVILLFGTFAFSCGNVAENEGGFCGDQACSGAEDCTTCARDCGVCPASCGDGICATGEDCTACAQDCGECTGEYCGDSTCQATESCGTCERDCAACPDQCGDGACTGAETCELCASDCGVCVELCSNGVDDDHDDSIDESSCSGGSY